MRLYMLVFLAIAVCTGCAQMKYSGRYQEVRIESEPSGASVLIEGNIDTLKPVAIQAEDGTKLAYHSPMQLKTPVVVILDKDGEYTLKMSCEGFPEYENPIIPRFAFHPFLIITFPVVPLWSDYEIRRIDDIFVDFAAYKAELEDLKLGKCKAEMKEAQELLILKSAELEEVASEIVEKEKALSKSRKIIAELTEQQLATQKGMEALKSGQSESEGEKEGEEKSEEVEKNQEVEKSEEKTEDIESKLEELNILLENIEEKLANTSQEFAMLEKELGDLRTRSENLEKEKTVAQERLKIIQTRYEQLQEELQKESVESTGNDSKDKSSRQ